MAVRIRGQKLVFDFRMELPDGRRTRAVESSRLNDNVKNRKIVEAKWKAIQYELKHGTFDYLHFFPYGSKARYFRERNTVLTLHEFWEQWMSEKSIRPNTIRHYKTSYLHIGPALGHLPLSSITDHQILVFRKSLERTSFRPGKRGLKASTINDIIANLCMCLSRAHKRGLMTADVCREIRKLKAHRPEINPFSFDELRRLLTVLKMKAPEWHDLVLFWSRIGLRPGELFALKWSKVDYYNRKLLVDETRLASGQDAPVKTSYSERDIDLRPASIEALKRQEARTRLKGKHIFLNHHGRQLAQTYVQNRFIHFLKLAGLRYRSPKQFRHTFATLHIAAGENITWVSKMLGHADVKTTLQKYNRFIPNLTRDDGSAFEKIMDAKVDFGNNLVTTGSKPLK